SSKLNAKLAGGGVGATGLLQKHEYLLRNGNVRTLPSFRRDLKNGRSPFVISQHIQACVQENNSIHQSGSGPRFRSALKLGLAGARCCHVRPHRKCRHIALLPKRAVRSRIRGRSESRTSPSWPWEYESTDRICTP